ATPAPVLAPLPLHAARPIYCEIPPHSLRACTEPLSRRPIFCPGRGQSPSSFITTHSTVSKTCRSLRRSNWGQPYSAASRTSVNRSEEATSELQAHLNLVCSH